MTRTFAVVTDSTADLPQEWHERYGIEVVPLKVLFGKDTFRDGVDMTNEQFFQRLAASTTLPTTSAPSPGEFAQVYRRLAEDHDGCISIHIGAQLSATAEAARVGAQAVEGFKVNVIDSQTVSMPVAFLCRVAAESDSLEAATAEVERRVPKTRVLALLDTLRYLEMGGRLSRAQAMIGTMLDLKPLLLVANAEIKPVDRVRTRSRAIPRMVEYFKGDLPVEHMAVMHAQAEDEAEQIAAALRKDFPEREVTVGQIGCVLGTHTGPKALGIVYIKQ
ncbi:MAG TPA: DegV family protein [Candidatus Dormibacteraeota bacterium]|jgi:DegV family protein with EDD domain|nr:DegV family protein [Candidatus Dormibacteraeota bacterium]